MQQSTAGIGLPVRDCRARCDTSINVHCSDPELYFCRQVVDTKDHKTAKSELVDMANIGAPGTDVATCVTADERLVAVATIGSAGKQSPGRVLLYSVGTDGKLTAIRTLTTSTGCLPDQIKWTKDCRTLIAAIEGEAGTVTTTNPPSLGKLPCLRLFHFSYAVWWSPAIWAR